MVAISALPGSDVNGSLGHGKADGPLLFPGVHGPGGGRVSGAGSGSIVSR